MQKITLKDQVYENILKEILEGKFNVDSIINEKDLSEKFSVSKTPVREALVKLCSEGILENLPRYGYRLIPVTQNEIREIIEYRRIVEVEALRLSFEFIGLEGIEMLKKSDEISRDAAVSGNVYLAWEKNEKFHWALCELCPNRYFQNTIKGALNVGRRYANQYFSKLWSDGKQLDMERVKSHTKIIEALENRDLNEAQKMLRLDIELMRSILL